MESLARELELPFIPTNIEKIIVKNKTATAIVVNGETITSDLVLSGADYHHTETLLDKEFRAYSEKYWDSRVFAPSSLLFYVGFDKKLKTYHIMLVFLMWILSAKRYL
jgi:phytoene desaturase